MATKTAAPVKVERDAEKELEDALKGFEDEPESEDPDTADDETDDDEEDIPTRGRISAKNGGVDSLLRRTERRMRKAMKVALDKFEAGVSERRDKLVARHEALISAKLDQITLEHSGQVKDRGRSGDDREGSGADGEARGAVAGECGGGRGLTSLGSAPGKRLREIGASFLCRNKMTFIK
jgi:hypothetical protein